MAADRTPTGREHDARAAGLNGIESIAVDARLRRLHVTLLGPAPDDLHEENFRIDGGVVARELHVVTVAVDEDANPALPGHVVLDLDREGDISSYRLSVVRADASGRPGDEPLDGFDPLLATAEFMFGQDCPALLDCRPEPCPPTIPPEPIVDYLAKDYDSLRRALLERLALTMPQWTERHAADLMVTLVELLAYAGDELAYQQDVVSAEAYLGTARMRTSVRRHARLVDYPMHDGCAARAFVCLQSGSRVTLPAGAFRFRAGAEIFEPVQAEDVVVHPAHGEIVLWTWGEPVHCLPEGATSAALVDPGGAAALALRPGDVLVLEEVIGVATGLEADADRGHRQAVRLVEVRHTVDALYEQALVEVTWAPEDALRFCFRVRAVGGPDCVSQVVGVARGNAVLVEHGASRTWCGGQPDRVTWPEPGPGVRGCPCPPDFGCSQDGGQVTLPAYPPLPVRFEPTVPAGAGTTPVTWSAAFPAPEDVSRGQSLRLGGVAGRFERRLLGMLTAAENGSPPDDEATAELTTVFGAATLRRVRLESEPVAALRTLSARFDEFLHRKLARLRQLECRARAGYVLRADDEVWEIGQSWGPQEARELDPLLAAFRGPALHALTPDPRLALPVVHVDLVDSRDEDPEGSTAGYGDGYGDARDGGEEPARADGNGAGDGTGTDGSPWLPRRDLLDCGPMERCFVGELDDDGRLHLRFGDGRTGEVPPPGATLELRYRLGAGTAGNVGAEAIDRVELCGITGATVTARNPLPATGGTDPEPLAQVRARAPEEGRRRLLRAITAEDYAALAGEVPGVQAAGAELRWTGSWYEAQVAVDAQGTVDAPDRLLDEVRERLHRYRRLGHDVDVRPAQLVPLRLGVCLVAAPGAVAEHVRAAAARVLGSRLLPDGTAGFFHPDVLTFGMPVRVSRIVAAVAGLPGVRSATVTTLERLFEPGGRALEDGVLALRPDEISRLDADATRPENGVLAIKVVGGR